VLHESAQAPGAPSTIDTQLKVQCAETEHLFSHVDPALQSNWQVVPALLQSPWQVVPERHVIVHWAVKHVGAHVPELHTKWHVVL
jgi:hypothetical protein